MIDSSVLQKEISKLLSGADLNSITSKKVRTELERVLGADLSDRKREIDSAIRAVLEAPAAAAGTAGEPHEETDSSLSDLDDNGPSGGARVAKFQKKRTKATESLPQEKQQQQLSDEELARQLHLMENGLPPRRRSAAAAASASAGGAGKKKPRRSAAGGSAFSKPCYLSPSLASVVGSDSMPRQQVVKRLWDIAKERNMFDPKNKQFVICDAQFEKLFGKKRLRMFALMKYLKNHVKNVDD